MSKKKKTHYKTSGKLRAAPILAVMDKRVRNKNGQMVGYDGYTKAERWTQCDEKHGFAKGFSIWLKDMKPRVIGPDGRYRIIKLERHQGMYVLDVYKPDESGTGLQHSFNLFISPRRHGKSVINALILLHFFCSKPNMIFQCVASSQHASTLTQWNLLKNIIQNTPNLKRLLPQKLITGNSIDHPNNGSRILSMVSFSHRSAYGTSGSIWISDYHNFTDLTYVNALQASLLDRQDAVVLCDSNVDPRDGHVMATEQACLSDDTMACTRIRYKDLENDFRNNRPRWISYKKAERMKTLLLPQEWLRDVLGQRGSAKNSLFSIKTIDKCRDSYRMPADVKALANGRNYKVGVGCDRAKAIFPGLHRDATVISAIAKIASPTHGESEIYTLDVIKVVPNTAHHIKKILLDLHDRYHIDSLAMENYEISDLHQWAVSLNKFGNIDLVNSTQQQQQIGFSEWYRLAIEGRFKFGRSKGGDLLAKEMATFVYHQKTDNRFSFQHDTKTSHDDSCYATELAIWSLKQTSMSLFTLGGITCINRTPRKDHCFLMGRNGQFIMPGCSDECAAFFEVQRMWRKYQEFAVDELTIQDFFTSKVKLTGARVSLAA